MTLNQWATVFTVKTQVNYDAPYKFTGDERRCALRCMKHKWIKPTDRARRHFEVTSLGITELEKYKRKVL